MLVTRATLNLTVCALLLTGCGDSDAKGGAQGRGGPGGFARGPTQVVIANVAQRAISEEVEGIGTTRANESLTITAEVTDKVRRVKFDDGQYVNAGDVLVELTNEEETALLAEAEANVNDANRQLKRLENLLKQGSVPVSQVDEARARMNAAQARYQSIVARLDDRLVHAPFSGVLGFRQVSEGTLITPGTAITTLDDISTIKLDFSLPEIYLNLLAPGMNLVARSAAYPDVEFPAVVRTIGSRVDPVTRSAMVRAHIDNADLKLRPGMLMTVRIVTTQREALMVPEDALVQRGNQAFVYTVQEGKARMTTVEQGARYAGWIEVKQGLALGDPVIVEGVIKVRDGSAVAATGATAKRPAQSEADDGRLSQPPPPA